MTQSLRQQQEHYAAVTARLRGPSKVNRPVRIVERVVEVKPAPKPKPERAPPPEGQFRVPPKPKPAEVLDVGAPEEFQFHFVNRVRVIQEVAGSYYGVRRIEMLSSCRERRVTHPRHVAEYIAKVLTPFSLPEIGRRFGGRDHTSILHGIRRIDRLISDSPDFSTEVATIKAACEAAIEHVTAKQQTQVADACPTQERRNAEAAGRDNDGGKEAP